mmetsp:Transcript_15122/g.20869  ORF Transcript_15122/g.20869 Transcript_15122/m.20869 type:complete len:107 (-) Transcript_15122:232-552(-)|eukprot:CAMPEP_0196579638 /NCGR_PEP_ID=MMETSP1081-20130531/23845_1 /TAXON_ID=36882 /ORGANISM="Pyramimonas amylifera, Strain CCMP720" /LENGTH=106 /DNA_ID=CAMNT_0041899277 /DNA_START=192 /DNA_END=512 /DNA_ORIENTATION=+
MSAVQQLQAKKEQLEEAVRLVEKQVYDLETSYLNDSSQYGNILKGFEGYLAPTKTQSQKKSRNFKVEDRLFSLSSSTSPATEEISLAQSDMQMNTSNKRDKNKRQD